MNEAKTDTEERGLVAPNPDPSTQYVYTLDEAWPCAGGVVKTVPDRLVHKVQLRPDSNFLHFEFVDEPGTTYSTGYGWAFLLAVPEELARYETYKKIKAAAAATEAARAAAFYNLKTLWA